MTSQKYFESFKDNEGFEYGLRFGIEDDAEEISKMFIEAYGYNYLYNMVYEPSELKNKLSDPNNFWFICEHLDSRQIAGVGLMQKRESIIYIGKMIIKQKFQKKGIARVLGSRGIMTCLNKPEFKESYKLYTEARTEEINAQKMMERIGIPYAFIPEFINFGDRRMFDFSKGEPFVDGEKESALLFIIPFERLWQDRETKIYMPKNEDLLYFYNYIKSYNKKT
ncbi:MAG: GNAT family N-acetyltransferase, partial [Promethearchaeota archaeon]